MKIYKASSCQELSPNIFTFDKYAIYFGYSDTDIFQLDHSLNPDVTLIGYCDANKLAVRPRDGYAIMVEINGDEVWIHYGMDKPC